MSSERFASRELAVAAYLQVQGFEPQVVPPEEPSGLCTFRFDGDPSELARLAREFADGAPAPALAFYRALNGLKEQIRYARGGWR